MGAWCSLNCLLLSGVLISLGTQKASQLSVLEEQAVSLAEKALWGLLELEVCSSEAVSPGAGHFEAVRIQILRENLELVLGQSAVDMKSVGTDRPDRESKVKKLKRKILYRLYILYF